jgi:hypothetical protein
MGGPCPVAPTPIDRSGHRVIALGKHARQPLKTTRRRPHLPRMSDGRRTEALGRTTRLQLSTGVCSMSGSGVPPRTSGAGS